ncbi:hypothetical protein CMALT394_1260001 [Carnobacterium maltaromaticum]|nr:hypothetical protein CMALT394_1260001 [Carnobacterium maltaromaticum]
MFLKYLSEGNTNGKSTEAIIINYFDNYYLN